MQARVPSVRAGVDAVEQHAFVVALRAIQAQTGLFGALDPDDSRRKASSNQNFRFTGAEQV